MGFAYVSMKFMFGLYRFCSYPIENILQNSYPDGQPLFSCWNCLCSNNIFSKIKKFPWKHKEKRVRPHDGSWKQPGLYNLIFKVDILFWCQVYHFLRQICSFNGRYIILHGGYLFLRQIYHLLRQICHFCGRYIFLRQIYLKSRNSIWSRRKTGNHCPAFIRKDEILYDRVGKPEIF